MLELFKTEDIDETNVVEAVQRINDAILTDHKSLKVLQTELAERDEKLLKVLVEVKDEQAGMRKDLQELSSTMHEGFNELHAKYDQSIEILKQIAINTKK